MTRSVLTSNGPSNRRLKNYPRVIAVIIWSAILVNVLGGTGWNGMGGQLLSADFLVFYGAGRLFTDAPAALYDFEQQLALHRAIVAPTPLSGTGAFVHPPYVAPLFAPLAALPYGTALILWTMISGAALVVAVLLIDSLFKESLRALGMSRGMVATIVLSLSAVVLGLYAGQMHALVLCGSLAVIALALSGHIAAAGFIVGLLAVKPQIAFSLGLLFLIRGQLRACVSALVAFAGLNSPLIVHAGWAGTLALYRDYLDTARIALTLPFQAGFPASLLMTPYGLIATALGPAHERAALLLSNTIAAVFIAWFAVDVWRTRRESGSALRRACARALLLPFLAFPYLMMYDATPLVIAPLLSNHPSPRNDGVRTAALMYSWLWVCVPLSAMLHLPLGGIAPFALWIQQSRSGRRAAAERTVRPIDGLSPI